MSISRKSGASAPENHPFVSGTAELQAIPFVVLKHSRVDSPDFNWAVPGYCIPDLRYFCDHPIPLGSEYRFFGIYPSEQAAFAAAQADHRLTEHGNATGKFLAALEDQLDRAGRRKAGGAS